jgi:hypothetical protein
MLFPNNAYSVSFCNWYPLFSVTESAIGAEDNIPNVST